MEISRLRKRIRLLVLSLAGALGMFTSTAWAITYQYDELGRVIKVSYDDGSYVQYAYDAAGNRTVVSGTKI